ncbi:MAG TPA: protein kinase [Bryobacteraceae bacterium]
MAGSSIVAGRYRIENPPIGEGGMGVVYKAFDHVTKRFVAVKTIKGATDPSSIEMFHKEWGVLARLCHPNIIDILDIGEFVENEWRQPYFVMPLLPGNTLDKLIKTSSRRLTPERTVEIISQACRGLQAAHDQGVVHRDIKPSNLFVMDDDTVKIIDFGVVHLADAETRTGIKGTLQYMAPEQLDLKPATTRSDIWSLGVVCYEALTGRKPFEGKNAEETIEAIRSRMPTPLSDLNPAVNVQVSQTVQRALAKEPYHRLPSIREFSDLLQRSLRNERIEAFDRSKILPRINRIKKALNDGDYQFAMEIITELESEGNIDHDISLLRIQAEQAARARTIHQLLESARTRMEEEEYPLALQKVQSVLNLEPSNVDALALKSAIERQRSGTQIERWQQIARQHIDNKLFGKARQAVEEISKIDASCELAKDMLAEIGRGEQQASKLRQEKQELYDSALKSYRNGEISTALNKLERVIELGKAAPGHPNTEAQYLAFYEQIRFERDELRNAYNEGKTALEARDFARALEICRAVLSRRPREPLFQALKIEVEDLQRQESSASVAQLHSRIEAEPDLDRKCELLKDAARQFPEEQTFQHSYRIVKERRDLVNSIVSRARHYESQGQFLEASNQWDVLRSIYSQYPGLEAEIQRLARKQEEFLRGELQVGRVEKIDHALAAGDYTAAETLVAYALKESPEDSQLMRRKAQLEEALQRRGQTADLPHQADAPAAAEAPSFATTPSTRLPAVEPPLFSPSSPAGYGRTLRIPIDSEVTGQNGAALIRRVDTRDRLERGVLPTRKVVITAATLVLVTAAVFFIWMIRGNGGSSGRSIQTPEATNHASQQQAQQSSTGGQSGSTSVMPDKQPLPLAPPMTPAALRSGETTFPVRFASSPAGAQVVVDGDQNLNCATPCELPLRSGRHTFTISAPDYEGTQGIMQVPNDKERFVLLTKDLETVHIFSIPDKMSISVDGESKGQTPLTLRLHAGEHKITSTGDASYQKTIDVARRGMNIFTINGKAALPSHGGAQGDEAAPQATPH